MLKYFLFYCSCLVVIKGFAFPSSRWIRDALTGWNGKWFPYEPGTDEDNNAVVEYNPGEVGTADGRTHHHMTMGIASDSCDNAQINLTVDWNNSPINFTCFEDKQNFLPNWEVHPILERAYIPMYYRATHICMNSSIEYDEPLPTFGPHRPLWAKYGEYLFLPKQRWIHNLEHGAIVMLYHPCANKNEVIFLKHLVQKCLYRHIITPYTLLTADRPLALVAWGRRLLMSKVDVGLVVDFIKNTALQGPEHLSKDGQFDYGLIRYAEIVSDVEDSFLCPNLV